MEDNAGTYQPMYDEAGNAIRDLMARGDVQRGDLADYMNPYIDERRAAGDRQRRAVRPPRHPQDPRSGDARAARLRRLAPGASRRPCRRPRRRAASAICRRSCASDAYDKGVEAQQPTGRRQFQNIASQKGLAESQIGAAKAAQQGLSSDYFNLLSGGKMLEDKDREKLEEVYKKFIEKRDWDKNQLTWLAGLLGITPVRQMEDITKTERSGPTPSRRAAPTSARSSAAAPACSGRSPGCRPTAT